MNPAASQARDLARYLDYRPISRIVGAQTVFNNGKSYIVQDRTPHLRNGGRKIAKFAQARSSKGTRQATTDALLTGIGG